MNGFTQDPLISNLLNQPILVWSLLIGASILVIAAGLGAFIKIRNNVSSRKLESESIDNPAEDQTFIKNYPDLPDQLQNDLNKTTVSIPDAPTDQATLGEVSGAETDSEEILPDNGLNLEQSTPTQKNEFKDGDPENKEGFKVEEINGSKSNLADIFEEELIIDPQLQAMRDNLPDINISKLQDDLNTLLVQLVEENERGLRT